MDTSKSNTIISKRVLSVLPLASILVIAFLLTEFHPFTSDFKSFFTFFLSGWFLFTLYLSVKGKHLHERYMIFILSLIAIINGLYRREIFEAYFQIPIEYGACIIIVFYLLRISFPYIKKLSLWFLSHTQEPPDTDTNTPNNGASKMPGTDLFTTQNQPLKLIPRRLQPTPKLSVPPHNITRGFHWDSRSYT